MPIIMIELSERWNEVDTGFYAGMRGVDVVTDRLRREYGEVTVDPSVYVVPGELSEDPAVFVNEEDAEAFAATYDPPRHVARLLICDRVVGAKMVAERSAEECDECGESIPDEPGGSMENSHHDESCSLYVVPEHELRDGFGGVA